MAANGKWVIIGVAAVIACFVILPLTLRKKETYQITGPGGTATITIDRARQPQPKEPNIVEIPFGEKGQLKTIWIQITDSIETPVFNAGNQYTKDVFAATGTKFVVITATLCNITNTPIKVWKHEWKLQDAFQRIYDAYAGILIGDYIQLDGYSPGYSLQPSIPIPCKFIFEIPLNSTNYGLVKGKMGTNDIYKFTTNN